MVGRVGIVGGSGGGGDIGASGRDLPAHRVAERVVQQLAPGARCAAATILPPRKYRRGTRRRIPVTISIGVAGGVGQALRMDALARDLDGYSGADIKYGSFAAETPIS